MTWRACALAVAAGVALAACIDTPTTTIELPAPAAVHVADRDGSSLRHFAADSDASRRLKTWVDANRTGWAPLLATPPIRGLWVEAGGLSLQFVDEGVILHSAKGVFGKRVAAADDAFLRP